MAEIQETEQTALFDFMVVRAPDEVTGPKLRRRYIQDWGMNAPHTMSTHGIGEAGLPTVSPIAKIVWDQVTGWQGEPGDPVALQSLFQEIINNAVKLGLIRRGGTSVPGLTLGELEAGAYLVNETKTGEEYYLLPDRLERLQPASLSSRLAKAAKLLDAESRAPEATKFDRSLLLSRLALALGRQVYEYVFGLNTDIDHWATAQRTLFDTLYLLYVARRWTAVNLEPIIGGLQALHAIEVLTVDTVVTQAMSQTNLPKERLEQVAALASSWADLENWNGKLPPPGFPLISSRAHLRDYLTAQPIIHPLFARLFWYKMPFNDVKPIGVGDLKVVRQWLTAYRPGEISHIHNIVKGERRSRDHRRLEKTEEVFSFTDSRSEDTTRDHQSTERFEVKAEAEQVLRTALNVNASANTNLTYSPTSAYQITASAGLGFGYNRASEDHEKTAQSFARDVVDKAVNRVESRAASARSTTKLFETEEKNSQIFDNKDGKGHVSGIYRWVDKEYTAQVFNYGKRLMFEFTVPEPAAFWIESRLRGYEAELDVPQPPSKPDYDTVNLDFVATDVNDQKYTELRSKYDLSAIPFPTKNKSLGLRTKDTGNRYFEEKDLSPDHSRVFDCHVDGLAGYELEFVHVNGAAEFEHHLNRQNTVTLEIGDRLVWTELNSIENWPIDWDVNPIEGPIIFPPGDDTTLTVSFRDDINWYRLQIGLDLKYTDKAWYEWQQGVHKAVWDIENKKVAAANQKKDQAYEAELAEYRNRLAQLDAVKVAEVLQGGPEAANRAVINEEIKKHCLTLLTKEFDTAAPDDLLSQKSAIGSRTVKPFSTRFEIKKNNPSEPYTTASFTHSNSVETLYPAIDIKVTRTKGKFVQFLEQAFEWERLSYIFYPYFWAEEKRWIELINRNDMTDPTFTAFLRTGMARVLVAVTPGYHDAVIHYLSTREPWAGGPSPVIGDPLFVPLYEEIRQQQVDSGTPVGGSWTFTVPTSLVYLHQNTTPLPDLVAERKARAEEARKAREAQAAAVPERAPNGEVVRR